MTTETTAETGETAEDTTVDTKPSPGAERRIAAQRDKLRSENAALKAQLSEFQEWKESIEAEKATKAEDWEALKKQMLSKHEKLAKERDEARNQVQAFQTAQRRNDFLRHLSQKSGVTNTALLSGLLREAEASGVEGAPEDVNDDLISETLKKLKEMSPESFGAQPVGGSPGQPGLNRNTKANGEEPSTDRMAKLREIAARNSVLTPSQRQA